MSRQYWISFTLLLFCNLYSLFSYSQSEKYLLGQWKVTGVWGLLSSDFEGKEKTYNACINKKVLITNHSLIIIANKSCLVKSFNHFILDSVSTLKIEEAKETYSDRFLYNVFEKNHIDRVKVYQTNYILENDTLQKMLLISVEKNHIFLMLYDYLIELTKN